MALRCEKCGNETRFEVQQQAVMRFAAYPDPQRGGQLREEKLPLGWTLQGNRSYVCRNCGSDKVADR
jgi:hypothetical protein